VDRGLCLTGVCFAGVCVTGAVTDGSAAIGGRGVGVQENTTVAAAVTIPSAAALRYRCRLFAMPTTTTTIPRRKPKSGSRPKGLISLLWQHSRLRYHETALPQVLLTPVMLYKPPWFPLRRQAVTHSQRKLPRQNVRAPGSITGTELPPRTAPSVDRRQADALFIAVCVLIGLLLRLDFLFAGGMVVDADEAIVGLMAKHISEGAPIPPFYYGQHYMGSFEPLLAGLLFSIFGASAAALKAVPMAFAILLIPLAYALGRELSGRFAARTAALLTAMPPAALVVWSGKARGGFIELVFLGAYALLLTIRWLKTASPALTLSAAIGFVLGFAWWTNNQIIFFVIPIAFAMFARLAREPGLAANERAQTVVAHAGTGVAAFFAGGLPFWIYNLNNQFVSFEMFRNAPKSDIARHFDGFLNTSIPILLGAKHFWETDDIFPYSTLVATALWGVIAVTFIALHGRNFLALLTLKVSRGSPSGILPLFLLCTFGIFVLSSFGHLVQAPRYLLPSYVGLFLVAALALDGIRSRAPAFALALTGLLLGFNVTSSYAGGRAVPGEPIVYIWDRVARDHTPLISFLESNGYSFVRTNYWIGYRLAFETQERVRFLVFREPRQTRIESYRTEGRALGEDLMPLVLTPSQTPLVETALTALGVRFEKQDTGGYTVLHRLHPVETDLQALPPGSFDLHATQKNEDAARAADGRSDTRWGSGEPQKPGMQLSADLREASELRGLTLEFESWQTDFARGLQIELESESGERRTLLNPTQYAAVLYYLNERPRLSMVFPPLRARKIILTQTSADPVFDWSVAELTLHK
jgi:hypothetical protein